MKKALLSLCAISMLVSVAFSQKSPEKFGKNILEHLKSTSCPIDSSAGAYVIFDYGELDFNYSTNQGFSWTLDQHIRIKILNKNELSQGEFFFKAYNLSSGQETVSITKASTYNLVDGKVVESPLNRKEIIVEETSENINTYKFALHNVEEGSLIEVKTKIYSPFVSYLRTWYFQSDIPVLHSELVLKIPEFFTYNQLQKGYQPISTEYSTENRRLTIGNYQAATPGTLVSAGRSASSPDEIDYTLYTQIFTAKNQPAFKAESYTDNLNNYKTGLEFELGKTKFGNKVTEYSTSWESVAEKLLEAKYFGQRIDNAAYARKDLDKLIQEHPDNRELLNAIYNFVQNKFIWNKETDFQSEKLLSVIYNDETGSVSDINFILLNMLKEAGYTVFPVALSTRDNGVLSPAFPTMDKFNYIVPLVIFENENLLLDATSEHCSMGILPSRCLNGPGRIIDKDHNDWIEIKPRVTYNKMTMYDIVVDKSGTFSGRIDVSNKGYASISTRNKLDKAVSLETMVENIQQSNPGLEITDFEWEGLDNKSGDIHEMYEVEIMGQIDILGDMISFNPMLFEQTKENPFKLENREYPVNFTYPRDHKIIFKYTIPDGYEVESLPSQIRITTPEKDAVFTYSATSIGNIINVASILNIKNAMYVPDQYGQLKQFYNQIVAKHAELIILKKTSKP